MDGSDPAEPGRRGRPLLAGGIVLALLAVVAVASSRGVEVGSGDARRPAEQVLDTLITLLVVVMAITGVLFAMGVVLGRGVEAEKRAQRRRTRGRLLAECVGWALFFGMLMLLTRSGPDEAPFRIPALADPDAGAGRDGGERTYEPELAVIPLLIITAIVVAVVVAWWLSVRARRRAVPPVPLGVALETVLDETVDDLRGMSDPREAVIAAYARLERTLGAAGWPREPAEAPEEYLARILLHADVSSEPASRLTALFATAKFSTHEVGPEMRDDAIEALLTVRDELRAADERREQARREALALAHGESAHP